MRDLTIDEVDQVSGAVAPVLIGGVAGGIVNGYSYLISSNPNGYGFVAAVGFGVIGGATAGMGGFAMAFYGSMLGAVGAAGANSMTSGGNLLRTGGAAMTE